MFFFWLDITSHQALNKLKGNLIDVIFNSRNFSQSQKFPKSGVGGHVRPPNETPFLSPSSKRPFETPTIGHRPWSVELPIHHNSLSF